MKREVAKCCRAKAAYLRMEHSYRTSELDYDDSASKGIYDRPFSSLFLSSSVLLQKNSVCDRGAEGLLGKL